MKNKPKPSKRKKIQALLRNPDLDEALRRCNDVRIIVAFVKIRNILEDK